MRTEIKHADGTIEVKDMQPITPQLRAELVERLGEADTAWLLGRITTGQNVPRKPGFSQVYVWPGTNLGGKTAADFEAWMASEDGFGVRVQFLEAITTFPDRDKHGKCIEGTGGRTDLFFAVASEDIGKFAVPRLSYGIRWIEDVLDPGNYRSPIYPERVREYRTW